MLQNVNFGKDFNLYWQFGNLLDIQVIPRLPALEVTSIKEYKGQSIVHTL